MAVRIHLLPFRTEKLSSQALMVLRFRGRAESCQLDSNYINILIIVNMTTKTLFRRGLYGSRKPQVVC